jgi:hypothetical protein
MTPMVSIKVTPELRDHPSSASNVDLQQQS